MRGCDGGTSGSSLPAAPFFADRTVWMMKNRSVDEERYATAPRIDIEPLLIRLLKPIQCTGLPSASILWTSPKFSSRMPDSTLPMSPTTTHTR